MPSDSPRRNIKVPFMIEPPPLPLSLSCGLAMRTGPPPYRPLSSHIDIAEIVPRLTLHKSPNRLIDSVPAMGRARINPALVIGRAPPMLRHRCLLTRDSASKRNLIRLRHLNRSLVFSFPARPSERKSTVALHLPFISDRVMFSDLLTDPPFPPFVSQPYPPLPADYFRKKARDPGRVWFSTPFLKPCPSTTFRTSPQMGACSCKASFIVVLDFPLHGHGRACPLFYRAPFLCWQRPPNVFVDGCRSETRGTDHAIDFRLPLSQNPHRVLGESLPPS